MVHALPARRARGVLDSFAEDRDARRHDLGQLVVEAGNQLVLVFPRPPAARARTLDERQRGTGLVSVGRHTDHHGVGVLKLKVVEERLHGLGLGVGARRGEALLDERWHDGRAAPAQPRPDVQRRRAWGE